MANQGETHILGLCQTADALLLLLRGDQHLLALVCEDVALDGLRKRRQLLGQTSLFVEDLCELAEEAIVYLACRDGWAARARFGWSMRSIARRGERAPLIVHYCRFWPRLRAVISCEFLGDFIRANEVLALKEFLPEFLDAIVSDLG